MTRIGLLLVAFGVLAACDGNADSSLGPQVIAHTIKADASGFGSSPMTTPAIDTPASGSMILVQILTQDTTTFAGLMDNMGNRYVEVGNRSYGTARGNAAAGSLLYKCENAVGGTGHTWSLAKRDGKSTYESTMSVVVLTGASSVGAWDYSNNSKYGDTESITTTTANSMVVSFWGPEDYVAPNTYTKPSGWTMGDSFPDAEKNNSAADAWKFVAASGTRVSGRWSVHHDWQIWSGASTWLVEVKP